MVPGAGRSYTCGVPLHHQYDPSDLGPRERRERLPGAEEERRLERTWEVGTGTLACPECDLPVMPDLPLAPSEEIACAYCGRDGAVRDFLTLGDELRPARVRVVAQIAPRDSGLAV
jgi:hypothetical protein